MSDVNWEAVAKEQMEIIHKQKDNFTWETQALNDKIQELEEKVKELDVWSRFAGYLLDNCEGETIWEESLQYWLSDMLKNEKEAFK